ncbi:MAG: hypothetical protein NT001_06265, partial [Candidatus Woesearchaeota archaeon]|nr:hypothetical protein [Candidatus Woesearchaeota archaeon]
MNRDANTEILLFLAISAVGILLLASGCTKKQTMNLTPSYKDMPGPESSIAKQVEDAVSDIKNGTETVGVGENE